jgi:hypothetical protein
MMGNRFAVPDSCRRLPKNEQTKEVKLSKNPDSRAVAAGFFPFFSPGKSILSDKKENSPAR